jgi:DNA-binding IclR family transcriptional regulator
MAKGKAPRSWRSSAQKERGGVQSVSVASAILKALAAGGGTRPLKDLAAATGLARAKVHRYLTSLRNAGFVSQHADSGHYQIGPALLEIGLVGLRRISPVAEVCNALPALRDQINQTVTAAVWGESGPIVVAMQESDHWITMNIRIGSRLPILTTAIGRTFLAHLPENATKAAVAAERRDAQFRKTPVPSAQVFETLMAEIRFRRLSRAPSALFPGIDAIAAPVFDDRGNVVAVVCVVARSDAEITGWNGSAVRALTQMAAGVSAQLGYAAGQSEPNAKVSEGRNTGRRTTAGRKQLQLGR